MMTSAPTAAPPATSETLQVTRVLVVEDDLSLARATRRVLLERDGCEVELAHDVASAEASLRRSVFDVVVSDYELPDGTGADVLRSARQLQPDAPRLLVTSHTEWSAAARAVNEGEVFRVLEKPVPPEALHATIDEALEIKRSRDAAKARASTTAREQRVLAEQNARLSVRASYLDRLLDARTRDLLTILLEGLELRRPGAKRRARCVAGVARRIGELAELAGSDLDDLELAGLLHAVGALAGGAQPDDRSLEAFDDDARSVAGLGHDLLRPASFLRGVAWLIRDQELPFRGAHGEEEPSLGARALAIAIRYVELVGDAARVAPAAHDAACAVLQRDAGARLDPALVGRVMGHAVEGWNAVLRAARHEGQP